MTTEPGAEETPPQHIQILRDAVDFLKEPVEALLKDDRSPRFYSRIFW